MASGGALLENHRINEPEVSKRISISRADTRGEGENSEGYCLRRFLGRFLSSIICLNTVLEKYIEFRTAIGCKIGFCALAKILHIGITSTQVPVVNKRFVL